MECFSSLRASSNYSATPERETYLSMGYLRPPRSAVLPHRQASDRAARPMALSHASNGARKWGGGRHGCTSRNFVAFAHGGLFCTVWATKSVGTSLERAGGQGGKPSLQRETSFVTSSARKMESGPRSSNPDGLLSSVAWMAWLHILIFFTDGYYGEGYV